jgi:ubiquinone/menaquinone biosynthesis C-methylase UbiE
MKKTTAILTIPLLAGFLCLSTATAQHDDDDSWEDFHNAYQPPELVMDAMGIEPGMTVAEVGAGRGRIAVRVAARVGDEGLVYANDIDEKKIEYLRHRCERDNIPNIKTILGKVDDPMLPAETFDVVYFINTYHHLDLPVEVMKNVLPSLKPGGVMVIVEHDPDKYPDAGEDHSTPHKLLIEQAEEAGFELLRREDFLERDYINIFRPLAPFEE